MLSTLRDRRHNSFGGFVQRPSHATFALIPQIATPVDEHATSSTTIHASPSNQHKKRRVRKRTPSDSESEQITGHVLASGKFKCSDPECSDLRFGRQADFRRHHVNVHAEKILEFFCPVQGCERSRYPSEKSKGRSFKGRRDKMEEHVQTVHHKLSKKRKIYESEEEEEEDDDDTEEVGEPQTKTRRY